MADPQGVTLSLDQIAGDPGDLLVRNGDQWVGIAPGAADEVLTSQGPGNLPTWLPIASGGIWLMPLLNPGAEDGVGNVPDIWIPELNNPRRNPAPGSPPPFVQSGLFRFYAGTTNLARLVQTVDVPAAAQPTIDAGNAWSCMSWWSSGPTNDKGRIYAEFQDAAGVPLQGILAMRYIIAWGLENWRPSGWIEPMPALTRKIKYHLDYDRVTGSSSDYYIDSCRMFIVDLGPPT